MKYRYELMDVGVPEDESIMVMRVDDRNWPQYYKYKENAWIDNYDYLGRFLCGDREVWDITEDEARRIIEENGGTFEG